MVNGIHKLARAYSQANGLGHWKEKDIEDFALIIITKCAMIATRCEADGKLYIGAEILDEFGIETFGDIEP